MFGFEKYLLAVMLLLLLLQSLFILLLFSPSPVAQLVAFALPKTDCWEDLDQYPLREGDNKIEMKGLGT